jgi:hypothetical protein
VVNEPPDDFAMEEVVLAFLLVMRVSPPELLRHKEGVLVGHGV